MRPYRDRRGEQVIEQARSRSSDCDTIIRTVHPLEAIDGTNLGIVNKEKIR